MAKNLYLYSGFTPNLDQGQHLLVNSLSHLMSTMSGYLQQTVSLDNYRINGGVAQVKPTSTMADYLTMSYAIEYDTVGHFGRAYFIKSAQPRADWIDYELEIDHWGTFMHQASIRDLIIKRCNRDIGYGMYDKIENTNVKSTEYYEDVSLGTGDYYVIFSANETLKVGVVGQDTTSHRRLYGLHMNTPALDDQDVNMMNLVNTVASTFQRDVSGWDPTIQVLKAWIIPTAVVTTDGRTYTMKFKTWSGTEDNSSYVGIKQNRVSKFFNVTTDPDYIYYFGTSLRGLELANLTRLQTVEIEFLFSTGDVKVVASVGDKSMDITDAFSVDITVNEGQTSELGEIAQTLTTIGSGAAAAASIAGALNPGVGVLSALTMLGSAASQVKSMTQTSGGKYIPGGDGFATWFEEAGNYSQLKTPYRCSKYKSVQNEKAHARLKGAVFNLPYTSLTGLKSASLLGTGTLTDTYVEADCNVMNIQSDAAAVIKEKLNNGIYINDLT